MSRTSPVTLTLLSATNYNDIVAANFGDAQSTSSIVDDVYRVDIQQVGVLGVLSGKLFTAPSRSQ